MRFDHTIFFDGFKAKFDASLTQSQVDGIEFLLTSFESSLLWNDLRHIAYALATTFHETGGAMRPVEEGFYLEAAHGITFLHSFQSKLRYFPYFGRGDVQLTWLDNYKKGTKELRRQLPDLVADFESRTGQTFDLVSSPEQALDDEIAFGIMTLGMHQGWFAKGQTLDKFINDRGCDYIGSRHIINGSDRAALIAGYARSFEKILRDSLVSVSAAADPQPAQSGTSDPAIPASESSPATPGTQAGPAGPENPQPPTASFWDKADAMGDWYQSVQATIGKFRLPSSPVTTSIGTRLLVIGGKIWASIMLVCSIIWPNHPEWVFAGTIIIIATMWFWHSRVRHDPVGAVPQENIK